MEFGRWRVGVFKNALVPLDGSDESARILPYVTQIAQRLGAKLLLLNVLDPNESGVSQADFSKYAVDATVAPASIYGITSLDCRSRA